MTPLPEVRWGIIGCGAVTEVKSGPALQQAERSSLVAVMRRDGDKARDYARRHAVARAYDSADGLIADEAVNAVYVATPPASHREYVMQALAAGKPVYVEKPMAVSHAECVDMNAAAAAAGLPLFVAYYRRSLPRFVAVREAIAGGSIGTPRAVSVYHASPPEEGPVGTTLPWRLQATISGGGLFVDLGSHVLDLLEHVIGPIEDARGFAVNQMAAYAPEDAVGFSLRFACGAIGTALFTFTTQRAADTVEIAGSAGAVRFSPFVDAPIEVIGGDVHERKEIVHPAHVQLPLIQSVVDELCGRGTCPSTGVTGARSTYLIDQILRDYRRD